MVGLLALKLIGGGGETLVNVYMKLQVQYSSYTIYFTH